MASDEKCMNETEDVKDKELYREDNKEDVGERHRTGVGGGKKKKDRNNCKRNQIVENPRRLNVRRTEAPTRR